MAGVKQAYETTVNWPDKIPVFQITSKTTKLY